VIAPDLPRFGYSDKPSLDYTPQFFAEFLSDFLDNRGVLVMIMKKIYEKIQNQIVRQLKYFSKNCATKLL
jgi:hypothetical protein